MLRARFTSLVERLGGTAEAGLRADELLAAWAEPARAYHGTSHLIDCLERLDETVQGRPAPLVEAALWYHDAIYDPRASNNEERSARWAARALGGLGVPGHAIDQVVRLILLTRHTSPPKDSDGQLVCDIDLSILGRPWHEFHAYETAIRSEYAWVPDPAYRAARSEVLRALLERAALYGTRWYRERYEARAHENLARSLVALAAEP